MMPSAIAWRAACRRFASVGDAFDADLAIVCVGTKGLADGTPDLVCDGCVAASTQLPSRLSAVVLPNLTAELGWDPIVLGSRLRTSCD